MTKVEILALQPGRELDALVAEKVMGVKQEVRLRGETNTVTVYGSLVDGMHSRDEALRYGSPSPYSTDIAAAWQVVEAITAVPRTAEESKRAVNSKFAYWWQGEHLCCYSAAEAAEAICKAALLAKLESGEV